MELSHEVTAVQVDASSMVQRIIRFVWMVLWFLIKILIGVAVFLALLFVADSVVAWPIVTIRLASGSAGLTFAMLAPMYAAAGYAGCLFIIKFAISEETPISLRWLQKFLFSGAVDVEGPPPTYEFKNALAWVKSVVARRLMSPLIQNENSLRSGLSRLLQGVCFLGANFFLGCWGTIGIYLRYGRRNGIKSLALMSSVVFGVTFVLAYTLLTSWASRLA